MVRGDDVVRHLVENELRVILDRAGQVEALTIPRRDART
jgi:hypothetical protein